MSPPDLVTARNRLANSSVEVNADGKPEDNEPNVDTPDTRSNRSHGDGTKRGPDHSD